MTPAALKANFDEAIGRAKELREQCDSLLALIVFLAVTAEDLPPGRQQKRRKGPLPPNVVELHPSA